MISAETSRRRPTGLLTTSSWTNVPFRSPSWRRSPRSTIRLSAKSRHKYARSQNVRFVILSNGNLHYFWDLEHGNPVLITEFPKPDSFRHFRAFKPNPDALVGEKVEADYVAVTQSPNYRNDPRWTDAGRRNVFVKDTELKFLRPYQLQAVTALQDAVRKGQTRFLFEMATGTGKTLTAAAVIKLFVRTVNAKRVYSSWIAWNSKPRRGRHLSGF